MKLKTLKCGSEYAKGKFSCCGQRMSCILGGNVISSRDSNQRAEVPTASLTNGPRIKPYFMFLEKPVKVSMD